MNAAAFPNTGKPEVYPLLPHLQEACRQAGFSLYFPETIRPALEAHGIHCPTAAYQSKEWIGHHVKVLFSIGGDGSFLQAAREMADYPILLAGIHRGDLGFLNSIVEEHLEVRLAAIRDGRYTVEKRVYLSSRIRREDGTEEKLPEVLNDIVVGHDQIGKMSRLRLWINGRYFQQYPADGLVISTPTGSTSYALSCGGPILDSCAENMLVVPICPHMIQNFSMVLPSSDRIMIQLPERERQLHVSLDGNGAYTICSREEIHICCSHKAIGFIRFADQDFFSTISSRLFPKISAN